MREPPTKPPPTASVTNPSNFLACHFSTYSHNISFHHQKENESKKKEKKRTEEQYLACSISTRKRGKKLKNLEKKTVGSLDSCGGTHPSSPSSCHGNSATHPLGRCPRSRCAIRCQRRLRNCFLLSNVLLFFNYLIPWEASSPLGQDAEALTPLHSQRGYLGIISGEDIFTLCFFIGLFLHRLNSALSRTGIPVEAMGGVMALCIGRRTSHTTLVQVLLLLEQSPSPRGSGVVCVVGFYWGGIRKRMTPRHSWVQDIAAMWLGEEEASF